MCVKHLVVAGVDVVHRWNREAAHFQELGVKVGFQVGVKVGVQVGVQVGFQVGVKVGFHSWG